MTDVRPLVFIHVPKTAGTALVSELAHVFPNALNFDAFRIAEFADDIRAGRYDFLTGHYSYTEFVRHCGADYRFMTFLRDPVERVISDYFYSTSSANPGAANIKAHHPTLLDYANYPDFRNRMSRQLARWDGEPVAHIVRRLAGFQLVGRSENMERDFARLMTKLGAERPTAGRYNEGSNRPATIPAATRRAILALNTEDARLCEALGRDALVQAA
ncbi:sulfotransferase family 2 domain-containing protein [Caulobacter sp. DWP3-1-3b2]|uniref:sulfotransferase family 2 domain-containing protein n=1 Tax=Caulobacter sp. DWP3-1-3b2 TaxID=2804643 RepID=UPI003CF35963